MKKSKSLIHFHIHLFDMIKSKNPFEATFEYHKKSSYSRISKSNKNLPALLTKIHYKKYPRFISIKLSSATPPKKSLEFILNNRLSSRTFKRLYLDLNDLSTLLKYSSGLKYSKSDKQRRHYPSAGARYPLETYVFINRVKNVKPGIYHYDVMNHKLELVLSGNFSRYLIEITSQRWITDASVVIVITAVFMRTQIKYGERGYRFVLLEAGHLAQNFSLVSTSLDLSSCTIGAFLDENLNKKLDIDSSGEYALYLIAVGKNN